MATRQVRSLVRNASDRRQVKRGKQVEDLRAQREASDLRVVLDLPAGRRLLWRVLVQSRIKDVIFSSDALLMAARAGQRELGRWLERILTEVDPEALAVIRREAATMDTEDDALAAAARVKPADDDLDDVTEE